MPFNTMETKLIAVIHHHDDATTMRNAEMVAKAGYEGVALIHMDGRDELIDKPAAHLKSAFPHLKVIANRLDTPAELVVARDAALGLDGSWVDNPGVYSDAIDPVAHVYHAALLDIRKTRPFHFFGSVAFKTQRVDPDPAAAALSAAARGWIPTTSGTRTGSPPDIDKLRSMRLAIPHAEFAVASGVDPSNAELISLYVDWILVSTGISEDFHNFDPLKVRALREATRLSPSSK